ncbi:hypothetical protein E2C01_035326 [Portunus trituberculatus]|uniref:Uncharacterized protein n=1 Tax=Portunus trituberculatus TaxID=210409 RepID=A0A5B7F8X0_PORTR|nr:hypothetical protein [Portunus trituberculatus]
MEWVGLFEEDSPAAREGGEGVVVAVHGGGGGGGGGDEVLGWASRVYGAGNCALGGRRKGKKRYRTP